jgi:lysozyme family protein
MSADFLLAFKRTGNNEGGSSLNPEDHGNVVVNGVVTIPTYQGIAPNRHPEWQGFKYITGCMDHMTKMPAYGTTAFAAWVAQLNKNLAAINVLQTLVFTFYKVTFWKRLGEIEDQRIAETIYDADVNTGSWGSKLMQRAAKVADDGDIGPASIEAINALDPVQLLIAFNTQAIAHYEAIIAHDPKQAQFRHSWESRLENYDRTPFVA